VSALDDAPQVLVEDRSQWRAWLEANHETAAGVWLVTWRAVSGHPVFGYDAAVEEAVCFGWVDSRAGRVDDFKTKLYFAPRNHGVRGRRRTRRGSSGSWRPARWRRQVSRP
jgi:uncharacterized protein YdeI (YjbR/CyaY-like superfamily)